MSDERYVIGMDCGTTNMKAIVMREDGVIVAQESCPCIPISPAIDVQEQDADRWWINACTIFQSLTRKAGKMVMERVQGLAISSHTVSLLAVNEGGEPIRNAITYQDSRSAEQLKRIVESIGYEHFTSIVGDRPAISSLPGKLLWFKEKEPERFADTRWFMQANSYINMKLTGVYTSDLDQAVRTQCMDIQSLGWSEEIGTVLGIDLNKYLPAPKEANEIIGRVTEEAAELTGLPVGIPVAAGCSDAMASMYALGISKTGELGESSGTSSLVFAGSKVRGSGNAPVTTKPCALPGIPWIFDAPITTTGATITWYLKNFAAEANQIAAATGKNIYDYLNELALQSEPGAGGLFFYPYLLGERAPLWSDYARSMFIGMSMNMTKNDMIRSVFEGSAFALRHVIEAIKEAGAEANLLRICGGGAKSRTWNMIKASMLNMPVYVIDETSGDVPLGDALIAGQATGMFEDIGSAAKRIIKVKEIIWPESDWTEKYDALYPYYIEMYQQLDASLKRLQETIKQF